MKTLLVLAVLSAMSAPCAEGEMRLTVKAWPRIVFGGSDVRVECRVPRIRTYRQVTWGLDCPTFRRASQEQLPGRVIYELLTRLPVRECGLCVAFCEVDQHDRLGRVATTPASVLAMGLGCPEEPQ